MTSEPAFEFLAFPVLHMRSAQEIEKIVIALSLDREEEKLHSMREFLGKTEFRTAQQKLYTVLQEIFAIAAKEELNDSSSLQPFITEICQLRIAEDITQSLKPLYAEVIGSGHPVHSLMNEALDILETQEWKDGNEVIARFAQDAQMHFAKDPRYAEAVNYLREADSAIITLLNELLAKTPKVDHGKLVDHAWLMKLRNENKPLFEKIIDADNEAHLHVRTNEIFNSEVALQVAQFYNQISRPLQSEEEKNSFDAATPHYTPLEINTRSYAHTCGASCSHTADKAFWRSNASDEEKGKGLDWLKMGALITGIVVAIAVSIGLKKPEKKKYTSEANVQKPPATARSDDSHLYLDELVTGKNWQTRTEAVQNEYKGR